MTPSNDRSTTWAVRAWTERDREATAVLLAATQGDAAEVAGTGDGHGPAQDMPGAVSRTLVVTDHHRIVGIGTITEYWLHPAHWRLSLRVHPSACRRGIGSALMMRLVAIGAARDRRPMQCATHATNDAGMRFLASHGFRVLMRTRLGTLDPQLLGPETGIATADAIQQVEGLGYRIASMPELAQGDGVVDTLVALHREIYRRAHAWNPPAPISVDLARQLFLDPDEVIPDALFVAMEGIDPIAVASLRRSDSPAEVELGWVGVAAGHQRDAAPLTTALVGRCLAFAARQRTVIRIEADEADRQLWTLMGQLPVVDDPDWLTYLRIAS